MNLWNHRIVCFLFIVFELHFRFIWWSFDRNYAFLSALASEPSPGSGLVSSLMTSASICQWLSCQTIHCFIDVKNNCNNVAIDLLLIRQNVKHICWLSLAMAISGHKWLAVAIDGHRSTAAMTIR